MKHLKTSISNLRWLLTVSLMSALPAAAEQWSFRDPHDPVPHNAEAYVWQEEKIQLPAYPDKEKLVRLEFNRPDSRFEFFIDPETLSVGEDGVVRYVLMLRSASGADNLMYEGIRCTGRDYKTFAFGTARDEFRQLSRPAWKEITRTSNNWFRYDLWKFYFCGGGEQEYVHRSRENILRRLSSPVTQAQSLND